MSLKVSLKVRVKQIFSLVNFFYSLRHCVVCSDVLWEHVFPHWMAGRSWIHVNGLGKDLGVTALKKSAGYYWLLLLLYIIIIIIISSSSSSSWIKQYTDRSPTWLGVINPGEVAVFKHEALDTSVLVVQCLQGQVARVVE